MSRIQFYLLLLSVGAAGLIFAFRSPATPEPITQELAASLERVDQVAQADHPAQTPSSDAPMRPQLRSVQQPWGVKLRTLSVDAGIETAIKQMTSAALSPSDRLQMLSYLREHEQDDPDAINGFALKDLALKHVPADTAPEWRVSYILNVGHLYLETASSPEDSLKEFIQVAESYDNNADRTALIHAYLQLYPEKKPDVDREIAGRFDR